MPYQYQGVETVRSCKRIELKYLLKKGFLIKGQCNISVLSWKDNLGEASGRIGIECCLTDTEKWIRLFYTQTNRDGEKRDLDYKINIHTRTSNLGFGEIYYFICPVNYSYCRILYMGYGSDIFKSRSAFRNRIYYPIQTSSKRYYALQRKFDLEQIVDLMRSKRMKKTYRGEITKTYERYKRLENQLEYFAGIGMIRLFNSLNRLKGFKDLS